MTPKSIVALTYFILISFPVSIEGLFQRRAATLAKDQKKNEQQQQKQQLHDSQDVYNNEPLVAVLNNNETIPYVGLGLGNIYADDIPTMISGAFSIDSTDTEDNNLGYRLIDTDRKSGNEKLISEELAKVMENNQKSNPDSTTTVHIVTKIWYTHLGYERTKISVQESMGDLLTPFKDMPYVNLKIHMLVQWPRCYEAFEWMKCQDEEEALPLYVKEAGETIPHQNAFAYLGSWRALEDMYQEHYPTLASIGVSNFEKEQMEVLLQATRIKPHIYQGNLEMVTQVMPFLRKHKIHPQMYSVFNALITPRPVLKIDVARRHLMSVADEVSTSINDEVFPATLLLSYIVKRKAGIMVRTSSLRNLGQDSPKKLLQVPEEISGQQKDRLMHVLDSLHYHWDEKEDKRRVEAASEKVHISFKNKMSDESAVNIAYIGKEGEEKRPKLVGKNLHAGKVLYLDSHPGHIFIVEDAETGKSLQRFEVTSDYGKAQWFSVEL